MNLNDLNAELRRHAAQISLTPERTLRLCAPAPLPEELVTAVRHHRSALVQELSVGLLAPLPQALKRMVEVAVSPGMPYPAALPSGDVSNLGGYVLVCAALYAAGVNIDLQLANLNAARNQWLS